MIPHKGTPLPDSTRRAHELESNHQAESLGHRMRLSPIFRLTAVLSSVLLLQLMLQASGTLCRVHGNHESIANAMSVAAAMADMPAGSCDTNHSCSIPSMPSSGCGAMASCVAAVFDMPRLGAPATIPVAHPVAAAASAAMPLGPALAPELPPPRA